MYRWIAPILFLLAGCGEPATTETGDFAFVVEPEAALVVGRNALVIELSDTDGQPVDEAQLVLHTEMPAHGHGSTEDAVISPLGGGRYRAFPVTLFMPGRWVIGIHAEAGAARGDFALEVDVQ